MIIKETIEGIKAFAKSLVVRQDAGEFDRLPLPKPQPLLSDVLRRNALVAEDLYALKQLVWSLRNATETAFSHELNAAMDAGNAESVKLAQERREYRLEAAKHGWDVINKLDPFSPVGGWKT